MTSTSHLHREYIRHENEGWSTETKLKIAAGAFLFLGTAYLLSRAATGGMPTPAELRFLLSSANKFGLQHISILRRFAAACNYSLDAMMAAIQGPAMEVASLEVASKFPPAMLPTGTTYSLVMQYPGADGNTVTATMKLFPETGSKVYAMARADSVRDWVVINVMPALRRMFADFLSYAAKGLSDFQILNAMTAPKIVLPHAAKAAAIPVLAH